MELRFFRLGGEDYKDGKDEEEVIMGWQKNVQEEGRNKEVIMG